MRGDAHTVKERLNIAEVIGGYTKLEKAGANFKARCPFHHEKTPSFFISTSRQTYYCFGCGEKGDVFSFVEKMEGLDFKTALKQLAERAGVELEYAPSAERGEKDKLYEVLEEATKFFEDNLAADTEAAEYLRHRGILPETVKKFRLGLAHDEWRSLKGHLLAKGYQESVIFAAGLVKRSDEAKESYDVFRGRVTFPLSDQQGRVIAFSGRALGEVEPKYLNSPDTAVFHKAEVLFGLDKAKDAIRKRDYAVLVEGQMDLVMSHQAGVENTVASSGTAFTREHLERLKRFSNRLILAFDGDAAGEKAAEKSAILALSLGMEVKIAQLPEGKDPADLARESVEAWKDVLRSSVHAVEFFLASALEREKDPRKLGKLVEKKILPLLALIPSSIERSHFVSIIGKRTGIREEVLWDDVKKIKPAHIESVRAEEDVASVEAPPLKARIEKELEEIRYWQKESGATSLDSRELARAESELEERLKRLELEDERRSLQAKIHAGDSPAGGSEDLLRRIEEISRLLDESRRKVF